MAKIMIYGATGYTGCLASEHAKSVGLEVILGGRTTEKLQDLASSLSLPYRTFDVSVHIDSALEDICVLLNCAGPFYRTARPLMEACIRCGVHYLDIAAELDSYEIAEGLNQKAISAKVMLMPGCGGSVAMLGCLAMHVVERMDSPISIDIALHVAGPMSRGSAASAQEGAMMADRRGHNGETMVQQDTESPKMFDFDNGGGDVMCIPLRLPDLVTIPKATGVSNVRTFVHVSGAAFPTGDLAKLPDGPNTEEREANPYHAAVHIMGKRGVVRRAVLHTVNGYSFTSIASINAARRALAGDILPGFRTPVEVFGSGFVKCIEGSSIEDV